ncbi:YciI family protein [Paracoccus sp. PS-1]|uniref:YciI family protein n=1 Tax=unclassified Paracoccus (in: a-proteobacteria) TaxID=2688777 RepID=UPI0004910C7B|nr:MULTISPECIES: YciI family protein [unclassified Paracoccus (in: a-proteobacteria)]MDQ7262947.1 YciI family protein [Paracoccus sp. PS1]
MLFAFVCTDKPDALDIRMANRPAHLEWLDSTRGVYIAGPLLDEGQTPCGSILVVEHEDLEAARQWAAQDPYAQAGLFESVAIREWKKVIGQ